MKRSAILLAIVACVLIVGLLPEPLFGQCAMCRQTLESSGDAASFSQTMNLAVLVLLIPPVAIFAGIFGLIYKRRNSQERR